MWRFAARRLLSREAKIYYIMDKVNKKIPPLGEFFYLLTIASCLHAIAAIHWFVSSRLKRKLGDFTTATGAAQIHVKHLARAAGKTAAATTAAAVAVAISAIAIGAINRSVRIRLERQL